MVNLVIGGDVVTTTLLINVLDRVVISESRGASLTVLAVVAHDKPDTFAQCAITENARVELSIAINVNGSITASD
jgi:hypothetical protein